MKTNNYKVIVEKDEDGFFVASVPALPGCHTQANDMKTLYERLKEVIKLCEDEKKSSVLYSKAVNSFAYTPTSISIENFAF